MTNSPSKKMNDVKKKIDTSVARAEGAVRVASVAVSTTIAIIDQAASEVALIKTKTNKETRNQASSDKKIVKKK